MMPATWKKYVVVFPDKSHTVEKCYRAVAEDGLLKFWMPDGAFIVRDGIIDAGKWKMTACYVIANIQRYYLAEEIVI